MAADFDPEDKYRLFLKMILNWPFLQENFNNPPFWVPFASFCQILVLMIHWKNTRDGDFLLLIIKIVFILFGQKTLCISISMINEDMLQWLLNVVSQLTQVCFGSVNTSPNYYDILIGYFKFPLKPFPSMKGVKEKNEIAF